MLGPIMGGHSVIETPRVFSSFFHFFADYCVIEFAHMAGAIGKERFHLALERWFIFGNSWRRSANEAPLGHR